MALRMALDQIVMVDFPCQGWTTLGILQYDCHQKCLAGV